MTLQIPVLLYHKIDPRREWGITRLAPRCFEKQIALLHDAGYQSISFRQFYQRQALPPRPVMITFDDAYRSVFDYAFPILTRYHFTATVFMITDYVGRTNRWDVNWGGRTFAHLDWPQIQQLAQAGWEMGSHSATHRDLRRCSPAQLQQEVVRSRQVIEAQTGVGVTTLAYPFGRLNTTVVASLKAAGYIGACTTRFGWLTATQDLFEIPRQSVYLGEGLRCFTAKLAPGIRVPVQRLKQRLISGCSLGTTLVK
ncbi:polysaccharide deacetylase family protein [candidate division KSB1 bacterium]|nr:polysaccharide deacetylase family protein [candidate division KSB1 bacterium]